MLPRLPPRVSVIVPAHNAADTLAVTLRSVESQTIDDWEVIVSDDGSSDGTRAVTAGFGERFRVVESQTRQGPAKARNSAVDASRGELLAFLDADDYWRPEYLAEQIALYERSKAEGARVGIITCDALILRPDGFAEGTYRDRAPYTDPVTLAGMLVTNAIFVGAVIPRSVFDEAGGFSPECYGTEDYDLWIRVMELGYRTVANPKALAVYRVGKPSVSNSKASMAHNTRVVFRRALERGRLGPRERRIARRELRYQGLIEEWAKLQESGDSAWPRTVLRRLRIALKALAIAIENRERLQRVSSRVLRGPGTLRQRLNPGWDAPLR